MRPLGVDLLHAERRTDRHGEANSSFSQIWERALKRLFSVRFTHSLMGLNIFLDWQQILTQSKFCLNKVLPCIQGGRVLHLSSAHSQHLPQTQGTRSVVCFYVLKKSDF